MNLFPHFLRDETPGQLLLPIEAAAPFDDDTFVEEQDRAFVFPTARAADSSRHERG